LYQRLAPGRPAQAKYSSNRQRNVLMAELWDVAELG
jgi:hypothetical protein